MERNIDTIFTELNSLNLKICNVLDVVEPIFIKDIILPVDIEQLKSVDFTFIKLVDFINILMPVLSTNDNGFLKEKELVKNLIVSTLFNSKNRLENLFESNKYLKNEIDNEYKTKFFKSGVSLNFTESFISKLSIQNFILEQLFEIYAEYRTLFDFSRLVLAANKESNLIWRKKIYLVEYDRVNILWLNFQNSYNKYTAEEIEDIRMLNNYEDIEEVEIDEVEIDEEFISIKDEYFEFLSSCQKAIDSINYQIEHSNTPTHHKNSPTISKENNNVEMKVNENKKFRSSILEEKKHKREMDNNPEYQKSMGDFVKNRFKKLTDEDIEYITLESNAINDVFLRGLDISERFFGTNNLSQNDIDYLNEFPFSGLLSDNMFNVSILDHFNEDLIGVILENCFGETINLARKTTLFISRDDTQRDEMKLKELIRIILKTNIQPTLLKNNILALSNEISELIKLIYTYNKDSYYITDDEREYLEQKKNQLPDWLGDDFSTTQTNVTNNKDKTTSNKQPITLIDFIKDKSSLTLVSQLQSEFKTYEGKRMAILIYILQYELNLIDIIPNSRTYSRKRFITLFKNEPEFDKSEAINKYISSYDFELLLPTSNEMDADYIQIKQKLTNIIENSVV